MEIQYLAVIVCGAIVFAWLFGESVEPTIRK